MIARFIADIEHAFAKVEYPGDYNIASRDGLEGSDADDFFTGKSWQEIDVDHISQLSYALIYFKPKAFIFFLPAFLIGCIKDQKAEFGSSCTAVLQCFIPPQGKDAEFEARMRLFNRKQLHIIKRFFYYLRAVDDEEETEVQKALHYIENRIKNS